MLSELLFGSQRRRLLAQLFLNPSTALHVRELARRTGTQPGTLNRELHRLEIAGLLVRNKVGNQVHYQADRSCPIFEDLANLLRKTDGVAALIAEALSPVAGIQSALIFGSIARGEETPYSDVDVLILGDALFADVVEALHPTQSKLGREINPVVYRAEDFREKLATEDTWAREVIANPKLFVAGGAHDFAYRITSDAYRLPQHFDNLCGQKMP